MTAPAPLTSGDAAYDALAAGYDLLTRDYDYGRWLDAIERLALEHGFRGSHVLDVACGTGNSFLPLLKAGYRITACDLSPEMVSRVEAKCDRQADLHIADMRELPRWGRFELITCLDDCVNHLVSPEDVTRALVGMRENLAATGMVIFDVNAFAAYRAPGDRIVKSHDQVVAWHGSSAALDAPGDTGEVAMDLFERTTEDLWTHRTFRAPHRHYPITAVVDMLEQAGLRPLAIRGQRPGAVLDPVPDESIHSKVLFLAVHAEA